MKPFSKILVSSVVVLSLIFTACQKDEVAKLRDDSESEEREEVSFVQKAKDHGTPIKGQYIVVLKKSTQIAKKSAAIEHYPTAQKMMREQVTQLLQANNLSNVTLKHVYSKSIQGFSVSVDEGNLGSLKAIPEVAHVEQDKQVSLLVPLVPIFWLEKMPYGVKRVGGGQTYYGRRVAWVIDTGIDLDHPDLNVLASKGFTAFTSGPDANFNDNNGHGTHVAGTIGAIDNFIGVIGVAAGARVVPVKVLNTSGSGTVSTVIAGVDHVYANAYYGDVANMSLSGGASYALDYAVKKLAWRGIRVAVAAGNSSTWANYYSPARANHPNIYTVSACDSKDYWAYFSNYGNPPIDFCAPGYKVYSTYKNGGYATLSGTSMAAPHVAGILLWGTVKTSGYVKGDPDGKPDPIAHR